MEFHLTATGRVVKPMPMFFAIAAQMFCISVALNYLQNVSLTFLAVVGQIWCCWSTCWPKWNFLKYVLSGLCTFVQVTRRRSRMLVTSATLWLHMKPASQSTSTTYTRPTTSYSSVSCATCNYVQRERTSNTSADISTTARRYVRSVRKHFLVSAVLVCLLSRCWRLLFVWPVFSFTALTLFAMRQEQCPQGGHLPGNPGKVGEFDIGNWLVRDIMVCVCGVLPQLW